MSKRPPIVTPIALSRTTTATICLPWFVQHTPSGLAEYQPMEASYKPLVNGKEAFGAVYDAIRAARHTVDIVCWGFQPSMYFKRGEGDALCIGDLLIQKGREGVKIRILCWADSLHLAQFSENSTPGLGLLRSLSTQNENNSQREYDRKWYYLASIGPSPQQQELADNLKAQSKSTVPPPSRPLVGEKPLANIQLVTRDFSLKSRAEIVYRELMSRADTDLSKKAVVIGFGAEPSHHQKMVLVDYEAPEHAVGFVIGHNMLDAYWDDDAHRFARMNARFGRNGATPRQDISSIVTGPVLEHLNENFCRAWQRSAKVDLLAKRKGYASSLKVRRDKGTVVMAQITRTQSQEHRQDIKALYLQSVRNVAQFIYIENQYFRWEPLADAIKEVAQRHVEWGRDSGRHGPIHLFVVTNSSDEGMGDGTVSTYEMLDSLGRADTMPGVARLERADKLLRELLGMNEHALSGFDGGVTGATEADALARRKVAQQRLDEIRQELKDNQDPKKPILPMPIPGLKIHVCTLVAPDSPADNWMPVYVHSKVMIIDDVFLTHGSANVNTRSMEVDSELNICHENGNVTQPLRQRLWNIHTSGRGAQDDPAKAFAAWSDVITDNSDRQASKTQSPCASLVGFYRDSTKRSRLD
ncbi:phospholipase [Cupriavidus necator]|uniref:Phospholipase n=1 Tax=Cupriavidus necator TaxID=106590 RepID=A0A1U9UP95_CUPNE|nr:phospholipase D-like domain-containing protein [Cupriavidus necator]AQV94468.1 phospholipase [Cupriavidus necator]